MRITHYPCNHRCQSCLQDGLLACDKRRSVILQPQAQSNQSWILHTYIGKHVPLDAVIVILLTFDVGGILQVILLSRSYSQRYVRIPNYLPTSLSNV